MACMAPTAIRNTQMKQSELVKTPCSSFCNLVMKHLVLVVAGEKERVEVYTFDVGSKVVSSATIFCDYLGTYTYLLPVASSIRADAGTR